MRRFFKQCTSRFAKGFRGFSSIPPNNAHIPVNSVKRMLKQGRSAVGLMLAEFRQPSVVQLFQNAKFDFFILDNEHGPFTIESIAEISRAALMLSSPFNHFVLASPSSSASWDGPSPITCIVRVPELTYSNIAPVLDAGAQGIMAPRITSPTQVREIVSWMKYPPKGIRGNAQSRGYMSFRSSLGPHVMANGNKESMLVVQIETKEAVEKMEEVVSVPGVDVALIGPNDLSIALGYPGEVNSPAVRSVIEKMIRVCRKVGVTPAVHFNELPLAQEWASKGAQMVSFSSEAGLMVRAGTEATTSIRSKFTQA